MTAPMLNLRPKNPKGGKRGVTEPQMIEALRKSGGNILAASQMLGITYGAVYQRIQNHPELAKIQIEASAMITDLAKHKVIKRIERDDWAAINLWLTTQAGWSKRTELTGKDGAPLPVANVKVTVEYVDATPGPEEDVI